MTAIVTGSVAIYGFKIAAAYTQGLPAPNCTPTEPRLRERTESGDDDIAGLMRDYAECRRRYGLKAEKSRV